MAVYPGNVNTGMVDASCIDVLNADETAVRIHPLADFSTHCTHNGMFVSYGEEVTW